MQEIIVERPYRFHGPVESKVWPLLLNAYLPFYLRRAQGIVEVTASGQEHLRASVDAGHGIMLAPNHCRPSDPMVLAQVVGRMDLRLYIMASRHLFESSRLQRFFLQRAGAFSMYREGMDRESLKCAIQVLIEAKRPLVVFPEGVVTRTNDRLNSLMEGTAFMARNAAKQRAGKDPAGKVMIHPVSIRYRFEGNLEQAIGPVLADIEQRLTWAPVRASLSERITRVGQALLALKEIAYLGEVQTGTVEERLARLIDHLLLPLESEWIKGTREADVIGRVKALRTAILPDMVAGSVSGEERARRWRQLDDCALAQQIYFYPPDYFSPDASREKMLETVERYEENLKGAATIHAPVKALVQIGEAIEVPAARERGGSGGDPIMVRIREELTRMLAQSGQATCVES
jgi:1-acyl-sn-glycerol-3-phosphate acyltransferase